MADDSLADFMKKELIRYVKKEVDKGHPLWAIKRSLIDGGHHKTLIDESIDALKKNDFDVEKALEEPAATSLTEDLRYDVHEALKKYIKHQHENGYTLSEIKEILTHYGHVKEDINKAIEAVADHEEPRRHHPKHDEALGITKLVVYGGVITTLIILLFFVSVSAGEDIYLIIVGFFPTIITVLFASYMMSRLEEEKRSVVWAVPLILAALLYIAGMNRGSSLFSAMDTERLAIINLIISLIYVAYINRIPPPEGTTGGRSEKGGVSEAPQQTESIKSAV